MTTVSRLPKKFSGTLNIVMNDQDALVTMRNIIMLHVASTFEPEAAASIILHLWYSVAIESEQLSLLQQALLPGYEAMRHSGAQKHLNELRRGSWKSGPVKLHALIQNKEWLDFPRYLEAQGMIVTNAQDIRKLTMLNPIQHDNHQRILYRQPPGWRLARQRFREDGMLLPFGASRDQFDVPNPLFFPRGNDKAWPMHDASEPMNGYSYRQVMKKARDAKNDIYGALHTYLLEFIQAFCERIKTLDVTFNIYCVERDSGLG